MSKNYRDIFINICLLLSSCLFALLLGEGFARVFSDKKDYLSPNLVYDSRLGHRIEPLSGGHDEWGFRNDRVPAYVDLVAIGDSHTYGNNATSKEAWVSRVGKLSGFSTYNMGVGGYGPRQYRILFEKSLGLHPKIILVALYMGNDLVDASAFDSARFDPKLDGRYIPDSVELAIAFPGLRSWLSRHSVIYKLFVHLLGNDIVFSLAKHMDSGSTYASLLMTTSGIRTLLRPRYRLSGVDLKNPKVLEGAEISVALLSEMNEIAKRRQISFHVLILPTKEAVYAPLVVRQSEVVDRNLILELEQDEAFLKNKIETDLRSMGVSFLDLTENFRSASETEAIYPPQDDHPNSRGYEVMARAISEYIRH